MTAAGAGGSVLAADAAEGAAGSSAGELVAGEAFTEADAVGTVSVAVEAGTAVGGTVRSSAADPDDARATSNTAHARASFTQRFL